MIILNGGYDMKEYIEPEVEVIEYSLADVIAASEGTNDGTGTGANNGGGSSEDDIPIGGDPNPNPGPGGMDEF